MDERQEKILILIDEIIEKIGQTNDLLAGLTEEDKIEVLQTIKNKDNISLAIKLPLLQVLTLNLLQLHICQHDWNDNPQLGQEENIVFGFGDKKD